MELVLYAVGAIVALCVVLWVGRLLWCWWFRIDEIVAYLAHQSEQLERIAKTLKEMGDK